MSGLGVACRRGVRLGIHTPEKLNRSSTRFVIGRLRVRFPSPARLGRARLWRDKSCPGTAMYGTARLYLEWLDGPRHHEGPPGASWGPFRHANRRSISRQAAGRHTSFAGSTLTTGTSRINGLISGSTSRCLVDLTGGGFAARSSLRRARR